MTLIEQCLIQYQAPVKEGTKSRWAISFAWAWSIKPGHYPGEKQHHPHAFVQKNADIDAIEDKKQINDHHTAKNREAEAEGFSAHNGVSIDKDKWLYDHNHS